MLPRPVTARSETSVHTSNAPTLSQRLRSQCAMRGSRACLTAVTKTAERTLPFPSRSSANGNAGKAIDAIHCESRPDSVGWRAARRSTSKAKSVSAERASSTRLPPPVPECSSFPSERRRCICMAR